MDKYTRMMIFCLLLAAVSSPVFTGEWKAHVVSELEVVVTSCVVVPCSFSHPKETLSSSRLRGIWHLSKDKNQRIYYENKTQIMENYRGRTQMLGHLGQDNCTLEIIDLKDHDNGPFCFRVELARTDTDTSTIDKFSFVEDCVTLRMLPDAPNPTLIYPNTAIQGRPFTVNCSVPHTCPSHMPKLTWSRETHCRAPKRGMAACGTGCPGCLAGSVLMSQDRLVLIKEPKTPVPTRKPRLVSRPPKGVNGPQPAKIQQLPRGPR